MFFNLGFELLTCKILSYDITLTVDKVIGWELGDIVRFQR